MSLRTQEKEHQLGFASGFSAAVCIRFMNSFGSVNAASTMGSLTHERIFKDT